MSAPSWFPLPEIDGVVDDEDPAFFGRYRLWFAQVSPWRDDYRAFVRVRQGWRALVAEEMTRRSVASAWPMHLVNQSEHGRGWEFSHGAPDDDFVCFEMLSDVCYIDMRNLHQAIRTLAPGLEDAHLFVYSSGDNDDRWVDEIHISDGSAVVDRWFAEPKAYCGYLPFCEELLAARDYDTAFRRFVSFLHADQVPWPVYRACGLGQPAGEQCFSDAMFSPEKRDRLNLSAGARAVASLDLARQHRVLHHLNRAFEIDCGNALARDLLDAVAHMSRGQRDPGRI